MSRSFFRKNFSYLLIGLSVILAIIGYSIYFKRYNIPYTISDLAYAILRLFTIDGSFESTVVNLPLNIARFLAPVSLATAIIQGFLRLFSSKLKQRKMKSFREHIIVCGDASNNLQLVRNLTQRGKQNVLLNAKGPVNTEDTEHEELLQLKMEHPGAAALESIGFYKSRYFIVSYENDTRSLLFVKELIHAIDLQKVVKPLDVIILFNNPEWMEYSADLEIMEQVRDNVINHRHLTIRYLNYKDAAIRKIMISHAPDVYKPVTAMSDPQQQVCLVGYNEISERLIINLALHSHYINHLKLRIYLFADSTEGFKQFEARYQLRNMLEINSFPLEDLQDFDQAVAAIYLAERDETTLLKAFSAFQMNYILRPVPKIVLTDNPYPVASLIKKMPVVIENISEQATVFEHIIDESIDRFAEIIHNDYLKKLDSIDDTLPTQRSWHLLSDEVRNRNRIQADHIKIKIRSLGCIMVPENEPVTIYDLSTDERFEALSKTEHERWNAYMYYKGWKPGPVRNDARKIHTDLIPYEELSKIKKDYDRNTIRNIPDLVKELGYKIIHQTKSSQN